MTKTPVSIISRKTADFFVFVFVGGDYYLIDGGVDVSETGEAWGIISSVSVFGDDTPNEKSSPISMRYRFYTVSISARNKIGAIPI